MGVASSHYFQYPFWYGIGWGILGFCILKAIQHSPSILEEIFDNID